jgi:hypothetical protein
MFILDQEFFLPGFQIPDPVSNKKEQEEILAVLPFLVENYLIF